MLAVAESSQTLFIDTTCADIFRELPDFCSRHNFTAQLSERVCCGWGLNMCFQRSPKAHIPEQSCWSSWGSYEVLAESLERILSTELQGSLNSWSQHSCNAHFSDHICWSRLCSHGCLRRAPKLLFSAPAMHIFRNTYVGVVCSHGCLRRAPKQLFPTQLQRTCAFRELPNSCSRRNFTAQVSEHVCCNRDVVSELPHLLVSAQLQGTLF